MPQQLRKTERYADEHVIASSDKMIVENADEKKVWTRYNAPSAFIPLWCFCLIKWENACANAYAHDAALQQRISSEHIPSSGFVCEVMLYNSAYAAQPIHRQTCRDESSSLSNGGNRDTYS